MHEPGPGVVDLGLRHAWLWSTACRHLGSDWLERGCRVDGISRPSDKATIRVEGVDATVLLVTISEDGAGGIEWTIEYKDGPPEYRRVDASGGLHDAPSS